MPFEANAARRHRIPRQRHRVTNWAAYEAGLRQRGSLTVWFTDEAIAAWRAEPRTTPGGQPWYSPLAVLTALTLRAVFRLGLRQTEGLVGSILRLLGLELRVPDHTTLSRRAGTLEVPRPRPTGGPCTCWSTAPACACRARGVAGREARHQGPPGLEEAAPRGGRRHRPDRGRGADRPRDGRRLPGRAVAGPGGGPGRLVNGRRCLRPGGRVRGGGRAPPRGGRRRAAAPGRGAERGRPRPRRRGATATFSSSPSAAAWAGRRPPATIAALWPKRRCPATSG